MAGTVDMGYLAELGELALGSRFKAVSDVLYATADEVYRARGSRIQGRWFPVLRLLHDRGPLSVTEIAREIGQTHSAVSQLAAPLVREGLVRHATGADRRRRVLSLTPKAEEALRELKPAWRAIRDTVAARLGESGVDLIGALAAFERSIEADPLPAAILARCRDYDRAAVRIVPFEPALREHFYRLNADWLRKYFYLEEIDHQVLSEPEREILEPGGAIVFARLHDEIVGTCAIMRDAEPGTFELTKMAVDERWQGLGIGRGLLEGAIAEFRKRRGKRLFLESNRKLAPALRLYESVGFEHQPARKPDSHYQRSNVYMIWRDPALAAGKRVKVRRRRAA
jgi:DNA-binding MarR family transcriptional regulator/ribosomal protein S18 acetylase RimI-like enzyme